MKKGQGEGKPFQRLVEARPDDQDAPQAVLQACAALLIESAEPFQVPTGRKQRVLMRLGHGDLRRRAGWLRPVLVAGVLLSGGAVASAALTHWPTWIARSVGQLVSGAAHSAPAPSISARRRSVAALPEPPPAPPSVVAATPARPPRAVPVDRHARRATDSEDPALLVAATRALRHDHDPRRARALAARYLAEHPTGALAEEALAVSIEAAIDDHDPDCAALSRRYLELYPRGSFRSDAERGLSTAGAQLPR